MDLNCLKVSFRVDFSFSHGVCNILGDEILQPPVTGVIDTWRSVGKCWPSLAQCSHGVARPTESGWADMGVPAVCRAQSHVLWHCQPFNPRGSPGRWALLLSRHR